MAAEKQVLKYDCATVNNLLDTVNENKALFPFDTALNASSQKGLPNSVITKEINALKDATSNNKGYFLSLEKLKAAYPTANEGSKAYVGSNYPYQIYLYETSMGGWHYTDETGGDDTFNAGEFYTRTEIDQQHEVINNEIARVEKGANYEVLEYETSIATTRLKVPEDNRKGGYMITYNAGTGWIKEQYIGELIDNEEWIKDENWKAEVLDENIQAIAENAQQQANLAAENAALAEEKATEAATQAAYAKEQGDRIANIDLSLYRVVLELPSIAEMTGEDMNKIYLMVSAKQGEANKYDEYVCVDGVWELLGQYEAAIDLTAYIGKNELSSEIAKLSSIDKMSKFVCIDEKGSIAGVMTKDDISSVLGIDTLKINTSGLTSNGTVDVLNHYTSLGACLYANQYTDTQDGIPWYSIGFDGDSKPFISGYYGMIFRAATGKVTMGSDGVMSGPGFVQSSDRRLKSDICVLEDLIDKVNQLKPCSYTINSDKKHTRKIGLIAQDVEEVFPQFVYTGMDGYKAIDYASMVVVCIKAIQELKNNMNKAV